MTRSNYSVRLNDDDADLILELWPGKTLSSVVREVVHAAVGERLGEWADDHPLVDCVQGDGEHWTVFWGSGGAILDARLYRDLDAPRNRRRRSEPRIKELAPEIKRLGYRLVPDE